MKNDDNDTSRLTSNKTSAPLAMETKNMLKKVPRPPKTEKQLVFEQEKKGNGLLDESQLHE